MHKLGNWFTALLLYVVMFHAVYLMMFMEAGWYCSWLTPMTNMGASGDGAETTTFFAPPAKWVPALSTLVKQPVDSTTYSAPSAPHGISFGSRLNVKH